MNLKAHDIDINLLLHIKFPKIEDEFPSTLAEQLSSFEALIHDTFSPIIDHNDSTTLTDLENLDDQYESCYQLIR